jgi:uncharacterized membrane protein
MTGIYAGFMSTAVYFAARGRYRATRIPSIPTMILLGSVVVALAIDGTNSLLLDMILWHPYEPTNSLRLITGLLTGISLAAVVTFLLASTLWRSPDSDKRVISGWRDLTVLLVIQGLLALGFLSGVGALYFPFTAGLLLAAVVALTSITLSTVVLFRRVDCTFTSVAQLQNSAFIAFVVTLGIMAVFGGGRFILEHLFGPPPLT